VLVAVVVVLAICGVGFYCYSKRKNEEHDVDDED